MQSKMDPQSSRKIQTLDSVVGYVLCVHRHVMFV